MEKNSLDILSNNLEKMEQIRVGKWWQNVYCWIKYSFNVITVIMWVLLGKTLRHCSMPCILQVSKDIFNPCLASKQFFTLNGIWPSGWLNPIFVNVRLHMVARHTIPEGHVLLSVVWRWERECVCMSGNVLSKRGLKHWVGCLPSKDPVSFAPSYITMAESFGQALVTYFLCSCLLCCRCA